MEILKLNSYVGDNKNKIQAKKTSSNWEPLDF